LSAANEIGEAAEEGTLEVFGWLADDDRQAVPRIDFNGGQFDFSPIEDEADLIVTVPGSKHRVRRWRGLRFGLASALASFPKLMNSGFRRATETNSVPQTTLDEALTGGESTKGEGGIGDAGVRKSVGDKPLKQALTPGSAAYQTVYAALAALAEQVRETHGRTREPERRATANRALGRLVRRDDVRAIWMIVAEDLIYMGRTRSKATGTR